VKLLLPDVRDLDTEDLYDLYDEVGPYLRADFVASLDGAIAVEGRSAGLGSPADKASFHALRTVCDAVIVGAGTLRMENYGPVRFGESAAGWREAHGYAPEVPVVVVSRSGDLGSGRVLEGPVLLSAPKGPAGVELIPTDPVEMVQALHARGLTRLLCEGGPALFTSLLHAGLVDDLYLTASPQLVGTGPYLVHGLLDPTHLRLVSLIHDDPGVLLARWSVVPSSGD
jgi:riboflavin biosynthesis pyrimidine reductase